MNIFVRLLGGGLVAAIAIAVTSLAGVPKLDLTTIGGAVLLIGWIGAWFIIGFAVLPYVTVVPARFLIRHVMDLSTGEFISGVVGLIIGLIIGLLLGLPMTNLPSPYNYWLPIGTIAVTGLGMMGLTVAKRADLYEALKNAGFIRPPERPLVEQLGPTTYVDTSALIDGRMTDVVASGFLFGTLVVPRFVVAELQHIADNRDQTRRVRGRRGLEVLNVLQKDHRVAVELSDEDPSGIEAVDAKLVELARRRKAGILTNDYNLNRVAQLDDVRVLNLNQLANALKPAFLPGDALQVKVIQQGKEPGQGLAYLDDGTMIVVEGGGEMVDREIEVTVVRVLQTVAGRMVFAQPRG
ncbi:MAG TPA: PIN domain-containing protein [Candidatus Limnocylindrales bacterium]